MSTEVQEKAEGGFCEVKRIPIVAGNWESRGDLESLFFASNNLNMMHFDPGTMQVLVAPSDLHLMEVSQTVNKNINVIAKNMS